MTVSPERIKDLIRKTKDQTVTRREMVLLRLYLSTAGSEQVLEQTDFSDLPEPADQSGQSAEERFRQILAHTNNTPAHRFAWRYWAAGVAAILVLAVSGVFLFKYIHTAAEQGIAQLAYRTGNGEMKEVVLPDSSRAWLNARSVLLVPSGFTGKQRKVQLQQGEVFFEVQPDAGKPFIVESSQGVQTRVLGTSFIVQADSNAIGMRVAVKTGKVSIEREENILATLLPGRQLQYDLQQSKILLSQVDTASISNWISGEVVLKQADFSTMAATMQQLYGLQMVAGTAAVQRNRYSLRIRYGTDAFKLVEVLCAVNGNHARWNKTNNTIVVVQ